MRRSLSNILVLALMTVVLLLLNIVLARSWFKQSGTKFFSRTDGIIESVRAIRNSQAPENDRIKIRYTYQVDGIKFVSTRIRYDMDFTVKSLDAYLSQYSNGVPVTVYYNPNDPQEAILERGLTGKNFASFFAITIAGADLLILLLWLHLMGFLFKPQKSGVF